ncbi:MAG TPA: substrate-binding domain-containing protein [Anaerolineales bacterium]|nr:substrate-binding domain-containing protein [Anaerolineales bacterium]
MRNVEPIQTFSQLKLLADSRRMEILRLLMASPATLTQLARRLGQSPAWIRHHMKALESADLVELAEVRTTGTVTEKFYRARAGAFLLQELVLPKSKKPAVIFSGSHDLALEAAALSLSKHVNLLNLPVGSLDGLVNLRQGLCHISGAHLLDENGEYNTPYIRRFFPDREMEVITLANRTQGLMFRAGNPQGIRGISDLADSKVRFVNRNAGSGTRLWLDNELKKVGIKSDSIRGYDRVVKTHSEAAVLIENGKADAALGLQAAAGQHGLDFIPLFEERYDLILPREQEKVLTPLLDYLQTPDFHRATESLTGYSATHSGELIPF